MVQCEYRLSVKDGLSKSVNDVANRYGFEAGATAGDFRQGFKNGLCALLTINDVGPVECRQPDSSKENCSDIAHLKID